MFTAIWFSPSLSPHLVHLLGDVGGAVIQGEAVGEHTALIRAGVGGVGGGGVGVGGGVGGEAGVQGQSGEHILHLSRLGGTYLYRSA